MSTIDAAPPTVRDVPHIETPPPYEALGTRDGIDWIRLPSGHEAVHLSSYRDVMTILGDATSSRAECNVEGGPSFMPTIWAPEVLINLDQPHHGRMRTFIAQDFSAHGTERLRPIVDRVVTERITALQDGTAPAELVGSLFSAVPSQVVCELLGIPVERHRWMHDLGRTIQIADRDDIPGIGVAWEELYGYVSAHVRGEVERDEEGLTAQYMRRGAELDPPVDEVDVRGIVMGIVLGGDNNIVTMATKTAFVALAQPAIYDRLVRDPASVDVLIEEVLRLMPLGTPGTFPRLLTRELVTEYGELPAGTVVYPDVVRANRDPSVFPDPDVISLDRPPTRHLQFGYGVHHCMGAALTRLELRAILGRLVESFPSLRLAVEPDEVAWWFGTGLRRPQSLPVQW
ncbi:MAG: cytochrome P450 [Solirubrobacteraceae bacterium]|nr:cytochrome P450 [Patulibacter sp.]